MKDEPFVRTRGKLLVFFYRVAVINFLIGIAFLILSYVDQTVLVMRFTGASITFISLLMITLSAACNYWLSRKYFKTGIAFLATAAAIYAGFFWVQNLPGLADR